MKTLYKAEVLEISVILTLYITFIINFTPKETLLANFVLAGIITGLEVYLDNVISLRWFVYAFVVNVLGFYIKNYFSA